MEPMLTEKPQLDTTLMGKTKILNEVELDKNFPRRILRLGTRKGIVSVADVEYTWIPSKCVRCGQLGYKESKCLLQLQSTVATTSHDDTIVVATVNSVMDTSITISETAHDDNAVSTNIPQMDDSLEPVSACVSNTITTPSPPTHVVVLVDDVLISNSPFVRTDNYTTTDIKDGGQIVLQTIPIDSQSKAPSTAETKSYVSLPSILESSAPPSSTSFSHRSCARLCFL